MKNNSQKSAFVNYEADAWFDRNLSVLEKYDESKDIILKIIKDYGIVSNRVLEVGCSYGYRLNAIKNIFPDSDVFGIDASSKAIDHGKAKFPKVNLLNYTADDLSHFCNEYFDTIIIGFVFYVIDRNLLLKVISEIDRILINGGNLIILDFYSTAPSKNTYQHIKDVKAYSYKQKYEEIFLASKLYLEVGKYTQNQFSKKLDSSSDYYNQNSYSILKKDISECYR
jgi:ubiquinone/menaquinone biosynthesis C-methylase UbiE